MIETDENRIDQLTQELTFIRTDIERESCINLSKIMEKEFDRQFMGEDWHKNPELMAILNSQIDKEQRVLKRLGNDLKNKNVELLTILWNRMGMQLKIARKSKKHFPIVPARKRYLVKVEKP